jgi:prepilin-type N-terminal cleavage/methylation domain-containing protein
MRRESGFTLLEVMIAMIIGTIGLLGTLAVQQTIISASKNANDAAVAMRLATQKLEELSSRNTESQLADMRGGLFPIALGAWMPIDTWMPTDASGTRIPEYVDAEGVPKRDSDGFVTIPPASQLGRYRWHRQWKVIDTGPGAPYIISVIVSYDNDVGTPKITRYDLERRKSW